MPPEAVEVVRAGRETRMEVELGDRAARAFPAVRARRDEHDGSVIALHEPRRDDPDHTLVPVLVPQHVAAARASRLGPRLDERVRLAQDPLLDSLPLAVQVLELGGEPIRLGAVLGEQQLEREVGPAEPAGRVDPRRQPERDRGRVDDRGIHVGRPHQRLQPGAARPRERAEASGRERAVLVDERDDVRDRRERDEVEHSCDRWVVVSEQRAGERVRDARAGEVGTAVVRRPRGDDSAVG